MHFSDGGKMENFMGGQSQDHDVLLWFSLAWKSLHVNEPQNKRRKNVCISGRVWYDTFEQNPLKWEPAHRYIANGPPHQSDAIGKWDSHPISHLGSLFHGAVAANVSSFLFPFVTGLKTPFSPGRALRHYAQAHRNRDHLLSDDY